ncbi:hypothetical protein [Flavobacterium yafengii]|uniref:hypothetical protein n=1 Tax=Flavobacterium yafengii TaxID=3041253 RepID=UPI0024A92F27|nr:hypothetical protein [Flavobacterium yafengii]
MISQDELKEFYNYKYWREIQRNQLTISSNIIFTFCIASIGFIINYLLNEKSSICPIIKNLFFISVLFFLFSIISYLIINFIKLSDYRLTAKLIRNSATTNQINVKTKFFGNFVWYLFYAEIIFAFLGFLITLFTFYNLIFA